MRSLPKSCKTDPRTKRMESACGFRLGIAMNGYPFSFLRVNRSGEVIALPPLSLHLSLKRPVRTNIQFAVYLQCMIYVCGLHVVAYTFFLSFPTYQRSSSPSAPATTPKAEKET